MGDGLRNSIDNHMLIIYALVSMEIDSFYLAHFTHGLQPVCWNIGFCNAPCAMKIEKCVSVCLNNA